LRGSRNRNSPLILQLYSASCSLDLLRQFSRVRTRAPGFRRYSAGRYGRSMGIHDVRTYRIFLAVLLLLSKLAPFADGLSHKRRWFLDGGPDSYESRFHITQNGTSRRSAAWLTPAKFVETKENQLQLERGSQVRGTQNLQCKEAATISTAMSCRPFRTIASVMESVL
jgi:hypothetical protein